MGGLMCWFSSALHRSTVRCILENLSGHKKLENIAFVRDFEHFDNEIDFSGLKGWKDIEVDNVKPQEIVSSLPVRDLAGLMPAKTMSTSGRRTSMRKFRNCTFLHSVRRSPSLLRLHRCRGWMHFQRWALPLFRCKFHSRVLSRAAFSIQYSDGEKSQR